MKSIGGVTVLQAHDSLNRFSAPNKSHRTVELNRSHTNSPSPAPNSTDRRRLPPPDPARLSRQMKNNATEFFAGSAFVESPPPSSVPIPVFFSKNFAAAVTADHDRDRTTGLRRILGLSLA